MQSLVNVLVVTQFKAHTRATFEAMESCLGVANAADSAVLAVVNLLGRVVVVELADVAEVASEGDLAFDAHLGNGLKRIALHAEHLLGCVAVNRVASDLVVVADTACVELVATGSENFALSLVVGAAQDSFLVMCDRFI